MKKTGLAAALMLSAAFMMPSAAYAEPLSVAGGPAVYAAGESVVSDAPKALLAAFETGGGPGAGISDQAVISGGPMGESTGAGLSLSGQGLYVRPNYWRGDKNVAESCVPDGNGGWIYRKVDAYDPTQDALYKVIREDGDWYVCEYFGGEIWLKKEHCTPVSELSTGELSDTRKTILLTALSKLGKPYSYGAGGPDSFDCSGFVNYCYSAAGVSVPRTSGELGAMANISKDQLKPGDILWRSGHVGIYLGGNTVIHSEKTGTGVIAETLEEGEYQGFVNALGD